MGRRVSKSGQINKSQSLISCAQERQQDIYKTMIALEAFAGDATLSGAGYGSAKGYVQNVLVQVCKAMCVLLEDEISSNEKVIDCCNTYLSGVELLDEDTIRTEINRLQNQIQYIENSWVLWPLIGSTTSTIWHYYRISELTKQIEKLNAFDGATQGLHNNVDFQLHEAMQTISNAFSSAGFSGNRYQHSEIDMNWISIYTQKWTRSLLGEKIDKAYWFAFTMEKSYGFSQDQAELLKKTYAFVIDKYGTGLDNMERTNMFWGMIASLCINYDAKRWHMTANTSKRKKVIKQLQKAGLTEQEILDLTVMINRQHGLLSDAEFIANGIEIGNSNFADKTHQEYINATEGYPKDFVHEAIQLAIFSNEVDAEDITIGSIFPAVFQAKGPFARAIVDIVNLSETGSTYTNYEASFKGDIDSGRYDEGDFISDMDAICVYYSISKEGEDPLDALISYDYDVYIGKKNRAVEFLTAIGDGDESLGWMILAEILDVKTTGSVYIRDGKDTSEATQYFLELLLREYNKRD